MVNAAQAEYPAQRFFLLFFQVVSLDMYAFLQQWDMAVIMLQIVAIDLLLGGDNAVVIAMACRKLPPQKRTKAIIIGTVGAILARVLLLASWSGMRKKRARLAALAACGAPRSPSLLPM